MEMFFLLGNTHATSREPIGPQPRSSLCAYSTNALLSFGNQLFMRRSSMLTGSEGYLPLFACHAPAETISVRELQWVPTESCSHFSKTGRNVPNFHSHVNVRGGGEGGDEDGTYRVCVLCRDVHVFRRKACECMVNVAHS